MKVATARVYDQPEPGDFWVLVDRLWPRGMAKQDAPHQLWLKDVAPSSALRKWYGHRPVLFDEFARRYESELSEAPARDALVTLTSLARQEHLVLVTATKDLEHSGAEVLRRVIGRRGDGAQTGPGRG
ncbi:MAG TPA: DUF488 family protein [Acidimicrobiales bacterium]|nr:DUF488 family protein [Acidimicrobiales bacterium]